MTKEDRKNWEELVDAAWERMQKETHVYQDPLLVEANKYIMKLERDIQNLRNKKRVASLLRAY